MNALTLFLSFVAVVLLPADGAKYTGRFDNLDIDEILKSERLLKNYFECLMERGPCTPEGSELRRTIPDALKTECNKCSETQKNKASKAIAYIMDNKPKMYKELEDKYDPEGIYRKKIRENVQARNNSSQTN